MRRLLVLLAPALLMASIACGDDPAPFLGDTGIHNPHDGGFPDLGFADTGRFDARADAEGDGSTGDVTETPDAAPDTGPADTGEHPDAIVVPDAAPDATTGADAADAAADAGDATPADTGPAGPADLDNDGIADVDEGNGTVDTDGDLTPDARDMDSDNDGIPDSIEAGDTDPRTPPVDTDGDGTPDFRDADSDNDGIPDRVEGTADPDNDRIPAFRDPDSDGDGIPDSVERTADTDGDMVPNFLDNDSDNDFIRDDQDGTGDADGDMVPNYLDTDSDGDGISDADEAGDQNLATPPRDSDFDMTADFLDLDSDNDTISDRDEGTRDTDGDGLPDRLSIDSDGDGVLDNVEAGDAVLATPPRDADGDMTPDYRDIDSDNDTILDISEGQNDTDGDMTPDRLDLDSDADGISDRLEAGDADPLTPPANNDTDSLPDFRDSDSDNDGLSDATETGCPGSTERTRADSDGDGFVDPAEIAYGSNPCSNASGIPDFYFVLPPLGPPAMAPLLFSNTAIDRADFAINVDNTGSMGEEIANLRSALSTVIIPGVDAVIPDAAFAVTTFEDYPIRPFGFGPAGDLPFRLLTRVTTNPMTAQAAVNAMMTRSGDDFPESALESLYQISTGRGTSWPGGAVPAFDPNLNRVPGVAEGTIGGVGFRSGALPVIIHVTDAVSHTRNDYQRVDPGINAADTPAVRAALSAIGARVVSIASDLQPINDVLCERRTGTFPGALPANDIDFFEIAGATAGQTVTAGTFAARFASQLDTKLAIMNATGIIAENDDISASNTDSSVTAVLAGAGPYYVVVTKKGDTMYNGMGGTTTGHYLLNVDLAGFPVLPSPTQCRAEDANVRTGATQLLGFLQTMPPANVNTCVMGCEQILGPLSPLFSDFTYPYEMSQDTNATIPACAWGQFGTPRPASCAQGMCCTGRNGAGVAPDRNGVCPLRFEIDSMGNGLSTAVTSGIEALVKFSSFTISTVVRPDPVEMMRSGLDTRCFIHGVVPLEAMPPNTCAPRPVPADLFPPAGVNDSFRNVVPGTQLTFQVQAENRTGTTTMPCAAALPNTPQIFRAYIDVVADQVTVVDTRNVIIIVPPSPPPGGN